MAMFELIWLKKLLNFSSTYLKETEKKKHETNDTYYNEEYGCPFAAKFNDCNFQFNLIFFIQCNLFY